MPNAPVWCEPLGVLSVPAARHGLNTVFGMNSGSTQRAVELAATDPANRARLGRCRELGERRRPKKLPRRAAFEQEPGKAGRCPRAVRRSRDDPVCCTQRERERVQSFIRAYKQQTNGGQATLKDENQHPSPTLRHLNPTPRVFNSLRVSVLHFCLSCPLHGPRAPIWVCRKYLGTAYARTAFAPTTIMTTISSNAKGLINTLAQSPTGGSSVRHRRAPPPSAHGPRGAFAAPRGPACLRHRLGAGS